MSNDTLDNILKYVLPSVPAVVAVLFANRRTERAVQQVHLSVNSRLDELLKAKGEAEHAAGVVEGRSEEQAAAALRADVSLARQEGRPPTP